MALLDPYLVTALQKKASDIHFSSGEPVRIRVDGDLIPLDSKVLMADQIEQILFEILSGSDKEKVQNRMNLDLSYSASGIGSFRLNIFCTRTGIAAAIRAIPSPVPTLDSLGLPGIVKNLTNLTKGLVLVTGPTGSGKSTTLAAMIHHINQTSPSHILTIEDPVEFVHTSQKSLIHQRQIGQSCLTFADALKFALREDPDVILVGEMRDLETISLALTAAETGHLVFGTLHTRGAGPSVDRIIDSFPAGQQPMIRTMLSDVLAAVISQTLLKRTDGQGRVAAFEIMIVNHAISNLIREGKTFQISSVLQTAKKEGMCLMDQAISDLVRQNVVTRDEAANFMKDPASLPISVFDESPFLTNSMPYSSSKLPTHRIQPVSAAVPVQKPDIGKTPLQLKALVPDAPSVSSKAIPSIPRVTPVTRSSLPTPPPPPLGKQKTG